jgi:hypothetical protein
MIRSYFPGYVSTMELQYADPSCLKGRISKKVPVFKTVSSKRTFMSQATRRSVLTLLKISSVSLYLRRELLSCHRVIVSTEQLSAVGA